MEASSSNKKMMDGWVGGGVRCRCRWLWWLCPSLCSLSVCLVMWLQPVPLNRSHCAAAECETGRGARSHRRICTKRECSLKGCAAVLKCVRKRALGAPFVTLCGSTQFYGYVLSVGCWLWEIGEDGVAIFSVFCFCVNTCVFVGYAGRLAMLYNLFKSLGSQTIMHTSISVVCSDVDHHSNTILYYGRLINASNQEEYIRK